MQKIPAVLLTRSRRPISIAYGHFNWDLRSLFNCMSSSISARRLYDDLTRLLRQAYVQAGDIGKDDDCQDWWNQFNLISHVGDIS